MPERLNITVIVCTYNGCLTLERALSSVAASTLPESIEWEVLVVGIGARVGPWPVCFRNSTSLFQHAVGRHEKDGAKRPSVGAGTKCPGKILLKVSRLRGSGRNHGVLPPRSI
jgi:hypothetical protein